MGGTLHKLAFTAAVVGALGFGGTQAFAAPRAAQTQNSCSLYQCGNFCRYEWCTPGYRCYGYCDPVFGCVCEYA